MTNDHNEDITAVEDRDLRALFAPRRPDAERFRAGVVERLRRAGGGGSAVAAARASSAWRERAASLLPALPPGTSLGSTLGSWLSLPALLVVSCGAAFWRGDRSLVAALRRARSTMARRQPSGVRATFWQRNASWLRAGLVGVAFGALGWVVDLATIEDAVLAVLLGSMLVLVSRIGSLAAHHGAPTEAVGACVADVLLAAIFGLLVWNVASDGAASVGALGPAWWVLVWGQLLVQTLRYWQLHRFGLAAFWGLLAVGVGALIVGGLAAPSGRAVLREELATASPAGQDGPHWRALELCGEALRAAGEDLPDLSTLRRQMAAVVAAEPGPWPETWSAGARLGLITADQWRVLERTEYVGSYLPRLLIDRGRFNFFGHDRYQLEARLATGELSEGEREHLVARIEQSWPKAGAPNPGVDVGLALLCVQWLDRLGRGDLVTPRVPELRELLARLWVAPAAANHSRGAGGFAARAGDRASLLETIDAVELLVRIGPPPEVELPALRTFLRQHVNGRVDGHEKQALACLVLLDAALHTPARGAWQWLVDERLLVGSLLLVVLSLRAVWFTRPLGAVGRGAQP